MTSQEMSSAWLDAMPKLIRRRGGMALPVAGTLRRYSDSGTYHWTIKSPNRTINKILKTSFLTLRAVNP